MNEVNVYRRRGLTLILMVFCGVVTALLIAGLVMSYIPGHSELEEWKITGTKRMISLIFMMFMAGLTWRYYVGFKRRGRVPVIKITDDCVRFEMNVDDPEVLYFHDIESFKPIEGNFETALVNYRVEVPEYSPRYPSAIEIPIGLTMNRAQVLKVLNERAAAGASQPAPAVDFSKSFKKAADATADNSSRHDLPPRDKEIKVYWERWAPIVIIIGVALVMGLLLWVKNYHTTPSEYLLFVKVSTWCEVLIWIFGAVGVFLLGYLCAALFSPRLVIYSDHLVFRGQSVPFADLENVSVESKRKRVAQNRYVMEHFIQFNYRKGVDRAQMLQGLEPDMLEMRPKRIAAIINDRINQLQS